MAKDYAKSKNRRTLPTVHSGHDKYSSILPGWVWFLIGFLSGLFLAILGYLQLTEQSQVKKTSPAPAPQKTATSTTQKLQVSKPRFDFYTLLPEMESETKAEPVKKEREKRKVERSTPTTIAEPVTVKRMVDPTQSAQPSYFVQVGSFRQMKDADGVKAKLILLGFDVTVKSVEHSGQTWYRVLVGPYVDKEEALKHQVRLKELNYPNLLIQSSSQ